MWISILFNICEEVYVYQGWGFMGHPRILSTAVLSDTERGQLYYSKRKLSAIRKDECIPTRQIFTTVYLSNIYTYFGLSILWKNDNIQLFFF